MGKMKAVFTQMQEDKEALLSLQEESHYWTLVQGVAELIFKNKSTAIIDDISHRVRDLYINGVEV